jgi:hypothetical protein
VFVDRLPVRAKTDSLPRRGVPNKTAPIPRPTRPPQRTAPRPDAASKPVASPKPASTPSAVNAQEQYDAFTAKQPIGTKVKGVVESFASHGAYVRIGDVAGYLPLRLMKSPAPRTPREHVKIGEQLALTVSGFNPARRSIEVSLLPVEKPATKPPRGAKPARTSRNAGDATRPAKSRLARGLRRRRRPD